jgi:hypothetical protein
VNEAAATVRTTVEKLEAAADLLINHGYFLRRNGFAERFVHLDTSIIDGVTKMAVIDWPATIRRPVVHRRSRV